MSEKVRQEIETFKRKLLSERKAKLTEKQLAFFNRIWPHGPPDDDVIGAIDLCDRTILKNESDPSRLSE